MPFLTLFKDDATNISAYQYHRHCNDAKYIDWYEITMDVNILFSKLLQDISVCLRHNPAVCDSLTSLPWWHEYLFTLLYGMHTTHPRRISPCCAAAISGNRQDIFDPDSKSADETIPQPAPSHLLPIPLPRSPKYPLLHSLSSGGRTRPPTVSLHTNDSQVCQK